MRSALFALLPTAVLAAFLPVEQGEESSILRPIGPRQSTCQGSNVAGGRDKWCSGFDINTDYDLSFPDSGKLVEVTLRIQNVTCNPDQTTQKYCFLINGQYPGPTIYAKWGDTLKITVKNEMQDNGTSIHWHGIRQYNSCLMDGVNGITECPIAPTKQKVYQFRATQYGTSWYHSHHSSQYGEGMVGAIVIEGPATSDYDVDLGPLILSDWYTDPVWMLNYRAVHFAGRPPPSQNVLINGTHINKNGGGAYKRINVEKGKKYRLRLINTAVDHFFHVSMDNHPFTVISADFIPIKPKKGVTDLKMAIGQRYDVVFTADQSGGNFWLRVQPGCPAGGRADIYDSGKTVGAIISYGGASGNPTSKGYTMSDTCEDEVTETFWGTRIPENAFSMNIKNLNVTLGNRQSSVDSNLVTWFLDGKPFIADWQNPVLSRLFNNDKNGLGANTNIYEMSGDAKSWYFWVILNNAPGNPGLPHPIHLHGHDFWLLGTGVGAFGGNLQAPAPQRRDVATIPAGGWMLLGFPANNPGSWVMHCHIAWHAAQGLSLQFLERKNEIKGVQPAGSVDSLNQGCSEWKSWYNSAARKYTADYDSGI